MLISILTLFPEIFFPVLSYSILGRARKKKLVNFRLINIRDFATDKHRTVDDRPYGGGVGMLIKVDVVEKAIAFAKINKNKRIIKSNNFKEKVTLLDPIGKIFNQAKAREYAKLDHLILVCGHYEGIDARITNFVDEKLSVGRYILTGGEIPSMIIADAVARLIPGVLEKKEAILDESYTIGNNSEAPQYTRPRVYKGLKVPSELLSGNHQLIKAWRENQSKIDKKS